MMLAITTVLDAVPGKAHQPECWRMGQLRALRTRDTFYVIAQSHLKMGYGWEFSGVLHSN